MKATRKQTTFLHDLRGRHTSTLAALGEEHGAQGLAPQGALFRYRGTRTTYNRAWLPAYLRRRDALATATCRR